MISKVIYLIMLVIFVGGIALAYRWGYVDGREHQRDIYYNERGWKK